MPIIWENYQRCKVDHLTNCHKDHHKHNISASLQLQLLSDNLLPVKARMPQVHQHSQLDSRSSHHQTTYKLSRQECHKCMNTVRLIPAPATIRQLTSCQGKDATGAWTQSAWFQLQPSSDNLLPVKARMPQVHEHSQVDSSSSHHQTTYCLSRQECHKCINTVRLIPAPATIRQLTHCQGKNATSAWTQSGWFQLQPPSDNLLPVKARMPQVHQHSQLDSSSSHHQTTYCLSRQECHKCMNTVRLIPAPATNDQQLTSCQGKNATSAWTQSGWFQLQPPSDNLLTVKARMSQVHEHSQLHPSSSHHQTTYKLSR